ncbi:hypothetical protein T4A_11173 [Trichinella pseudospiralis]|uniref:MULE transposase domain-containing protein n=1 Tax=Trichinella pseudospiralis TaxID=6337 RepID=A0A0V1EJW0_TRIPS|nr:hypothetical protein T4A_11173 [Trichinella pseudospiralis]
MRILLEMFYPMKTCMQGVEVQKELRKPVIIILDDFLLLSKIDELAALLHNEHVQISEMEPVEEYLNDDKLICYFQISWQGFYAYYESLRRTTSTTLCHNDQLFVNAHLTRRVKRPLTVSDKLIEVHRGIYWYLLRVPTLDCWQSCEPWTWIVLSRFYYNDINNCLPSMPLWRVSWCQQSTVYVRGQPQLNPQTIICDFETALIPAIHGYFPNTKAFHVCQAVHRKVRALAPKTRYKTEAETRKNIRMLRATAFLSVTQVDTGDSLFQAGTTADRGRHEAELWNEDIRYMRFPKGPNSVSLG